MSRYFWSRRIPLRHIAVALAVTAGLAVGGCAFDPSSVPVPGTTVSGDTYRIRIEFANVLNLPARAKVVANGAQVGTVDKVTVVPADKAPAGRGGYVVVDADISTSARLPKTTIAELRQNTVLGDIHLALTTPPDGFGSLLGSGDTIPISRSKAPVQLEDTMAALAFFNQGGAVGNLQDIIGRFNSVLPPEPKETARISETMRSDLIDLAANQDKVTQMLDGLDANVYENYRLMPQLEELLSEKSVQRVTDSVSSIHNVTNIFAQLGPLGQSLTWLAPVLGGVDGTLKAFVPLATGGPLDLSKPTNLKLLVEFLRDKVIPFAEHGPKVNVTKVQVDSVSQQDQIDRIIQILRMIGVVR
ncbi:MlaD family protein [Nocardia altamirensis]|uniref:MlaD family protein n=1 Tax=Nocardia altamirensis TaxID=472158 RepID=UPI0009FED745|nr:MlaD family protein [Nocardia altamirensis]